MTYLLKTEVAHGCHIPLNEHHNPATPAGSVWRCDECGQHWMVYTRSDDHGAAWHAVSPRRAKRAIRRAGR